jgi:photosystem II stability/assembly factor-like uncharacterized protein
MKRNILCILIVIVAFSTSAQQSWERKYAPLMTKFNYMDKIGGRLFICAGENYGNNDYGYYSDDNGDSWNKIPELNATFAIVNLSGTLYACSHDTLFRSVDNGTTWIPHDTLTPGSVSSFKENNGYFYIADKYRYRFYMSADTGSTWQEINPVGYNSILDFAAENGNIFIYRSSTDEFMYSPDNGMTFSTIPLPFIPFNFDFLTLKNSILYAGCDKGFFISNDLGSSWTREVTGLSGQDTNIAHTLIRDSTIYICTAYGNIFRSALSPISWTQIGSRSFYYAPYFFDAGTEYLIGTDRGFYRSTDNAISWSLHNKGIEPNTIPYSLSGNAGEVWAGSDRGTARSTDAGNTWSEILTTGENIYVYTDTIITIDRWGVMQRSFDNGLSWGFSQPVSGSQLRSFTVKNSAWYLGTSTGLYTSDDYGDNWTRRDIDSTLAGESTYSVYKDDNGTLFVALVWNVYRSTDDGSSWQLIPSLLTSPDEAGFYREGSLLYFWSRFQGIYRSSDNGLTWSPVNNGLSGYDIKQLTSYNSELYIVDGYNYYGGFISKGIYRLNDTTWVPFDTTMQNITMLGAGAGGLFIGVDSKGVYKLAIAGTGINDSVAEETELIIFPNPAEDLITIRCPKMKNARICNLLGQVCWFSDVKTDELSISLANKPRGVYFVEIDTGSRKLVKKVVKE